MTQLDIIQTILRDSNYHLDLFDTSEIQSLRQRIEGQKTPITYCPIQETESHLIL